MNQYVADTHALYWYLTGSPLLGLSAARAFAEGSSGQAQVYVPSIVFAELFWLNERAGRPLNIAAELGKLRAARQFVFVPFGVQDVIDFDRDSVVPEMHDRIVVGVSRRLRATCITRDAKIVASGIVPTLW